MRKSNAIIFAILVVMSIFFLWLWYYLSFNLVDNPLDLVLTVLWWAVVIIACTAIHKVEAKRCERIRSCFIADGALWNPEKGIVRFNSMLTLTDGTKVHVPSDPIAAVELVLADLKYGFDMAEFPENSIEYRFKHVIRSKRFNTNTASWEGEVAYANKPDDPAVPFSNKVELSHILEGTPMPSTVSTLGGFQAHGA